MAVTTPYPEISSDPLRGFLRAGEILLAGVLLFLFSEGLIAQLLTSESDPDGSPIVRMMWIPAYGVVLMLAVLQAGRICRLLLRAPTLAVLVLIATASVFWSIDPALTQRRSIAIACTVAFGLYLAARYDWRTLLVLLGIVSLVLTVMNLIAGGIFPAFGVMHEIHEGAWKGIWWEKNTLGGHMARASFLFTFLLVTDSQRMKLWAIGLFMSGTLVFLSTSKTALLGMFLGFAIIAVCSWIKRGPRTAITLIWAGVSMCGGVCLALVLAPEAVFGLIGREPTLTGRTDIWAALMRAIEQRPVLGYGYGSFWTLESEPAYWVRQEVEWIAPTAHNGWLEILLGLGVLGLAVFVIDALLAFWRAGWAVVFGWPGIFALGFLAQFVLFSMSESIVLQQNALVWVVYVAVVGRLALEADARSTLSRNARRVPSHLGEMRPVCINC